MPRDINSNRFLKAGKELVKSTPKKEVENIAPKANPDTDIKNDVDTAAKANPDANTEAEVNKDTKVIKKKDKVITAKVYPETWQIFTEINKAQGMTNNSVINMLLSEYVRSKKDEILG